MRIVNCTPGNQLNESIQRDITQLEAKLQTAKYADECRYEIRNFQRHFCCIFIRDGKFSEEGKWAVTDLPELIENPEIFEKLFQE